MLKLCLKLCSERVQHKAGELRLSSTVRREDVICWGGSGGGGSRSVVWVLPSGAEGQLRHEKRPQWGTVLLPHCLVALEVGRTLCEAGRANVHHCQNVFSVF